MAKFSGKHKVRLKEEITTMTIHKILCPSCDRRMHTQDIYAGLDDSGAVMSDLVCPKCHAVISVEGVPEYKTVHNKKYRQGEFTVDYMNFPEGIDRDRLMTVGDRNGDSDGEE